MIRYVECFAWEDVIMRDLKAFIPNSSFRYGEFVASNTATKYNIDNIPTNPHYWNNIEYLVGSCLQPAREYFNVPMRILSGYRSPALNAHPKVQGSPTSFHSFACAGDTDFGNTASPTLWELFEWFYHNVPFTELIAENLPSGWIHIAIMRGREHERQLKYKLVGQPVKRGCSLQEIQNILKGVK